VRTVVAVLAPTRELLTGEVVTVNAGRVVNRLVAPVEDTLCSRTRTKCRL